MSQNATLTLRQHTTKVTSLVSCHGSGLAALLSADETGRVICWDLLTRRPVWVLTLESPAPVVDLQVMQDKYLCVLSRDYTLRVYDLDHREQVLFQMNVNTLNFANMGLETVNDETLRLYCCNTQQSELLDVYEINLRTNGLTRIFHKLDFFPIVKDTVLAHTPSGKIDKLGMIMKFTTVRSDSVLFVGYESGVVLGLQYWKDQEPVLKVVYVSILHLPEPILELTLTDNDTVLYSASTSNIIGNSDIRYLSNDIMVATSKKNGKVMYSPDLPISNPKSIPVKGHKISHIGSTSQYLIWSTWQGKTYLLDKQKDEVIAKWVKSKSSVQPNESSQGDLNNSSRDVKLSKNIKIGSMAIFDKEKYQYLNKEVSNIPVKSLSQQRRMNQFINHDWCFIGYEDGSIALHRL